MNISYELRGHTALITVDRPQALNALNRDVLEELDKAVLRSESDEDVYVLIITGAGKAFVAGADIQGMKDFSPDEAKAFSEYGNDVFLRIETLSKPTIAAVNGYALGGGCELCMACDIRIAGEKAKFGLPEVGLGITPGFGGTQRLPAIVGQSKAKELVFTAATINAQEALRIGLVSQVVSNDELISTAFGIAGRIAENGQFAVRQSKAVISKGYQSVQSEGIAIEAQSFSLCFGTQYQKDAMTAFVNGSKTAAKKAK